MYCNVCSTKQRYDDMMEGDFDNRPTELPPYVTLREPCQVQTVDSSSRLSGVSRDSGASSGATVVAGEDALWQLAGLKLSEFCREALNDSSEIPQKTEMRSSGKIGHRSRSTEKKLKKERGSSEKKLSRNTGSKDSSIDNEIGFINKSNVSTESGQNVLDKVSEKIEKSNVINPDSMANPLNESGVSKVSLKLSTDRRSKSASDKTAGVENEVESIKKDATHIVAQESENLLNRDSGVRSSSRRKKKVQISADDLKNQQERHEDYKSVDDVINRGIDHHEDYSAKEEDHDVSMDKIKSGNTTLDSGVMEKSQSGNSTVGSETSFPSYGFDLNGVDYVDGFALINNFHGNQKTVATDNLGISSNLGSDASLSSQKGKKFDSDDVIKILSQKKVVKKRESKSVDETGKQSGRRAKKLVAEIIDDSEGVLNRTAERGAIMSDNRGTNIDLQESGSLQTLLADQNNNNPSDLQQEQKRGTTVSIPLSLDTEAIKGISNIQKITKSKEKRNSLSSSTTPPSEKREKTEIAGNILTEKASNLETKSTSMSSGIDPINWQLQSSTSTLTKTSFSQTNKSVMSSTEVVAKDKLSEIADKSDVLKAKIDKSKTATEDIKMDVNELIDKDKALQRQVESPSSVDRTMKISKSVNEGDKKEVIEISNNDRTNHGTNERSNSADRSKHHREGFIKKVTKGVKKELTEGFHRDKAHQKKDERSSSADVNIDSSKKEPVNVIKERSETINGDKSGKQDEVSNGDDTSKDISKRVTENIEKDIIERVNDDGASRRLDGRTLSSDSRKDIKKKKVGLTEGNSTDVTETIFMSKTQQRLDERSIGVDSNKDVNKNTAEGIIQEATESPVKDKTQKTHRKHDRVSSSVDRIKDISKKVTGGIKKEVTKTIHRDKTPKRHDEEPGSKEIRHHSKDRKAVVVVDELPQDGPPASLEKDTKGSNLKETNKIESRQPDEALERKKHVEKPIASPRTSLLNQASELPSVTDVATKKLKGESSSKSEVPSTSSGEKTDIQGTKVDKNEPVLNIDDRIVKKDHSAKIIDSGLDIQKDTPKKIKQEPSQVGDEQSARNQRRSSGRRKSAENDKSKPRAGIESIPFPFMDDEVDVLNESQSSIDLLQEIGDMKKKGFYSLTRVSEGPRADQADAGKPKSVYIKDQLLWFTPGEPPRIQLDYSQPIDGSMQFRRHHPDFAKSGGMDSSVRRSVREVKRGGKGIKSAARSSSSEDILLLYSLRSSSPATYAKEFLNTSIEYPTRHSRGGISDSKASQKVLSNARASRMENSSESSSAKPFVGSNRQQIRGSASLSKSTQCLSSETSYSSQHFQLRKLKELAPQTSKDSSSSQTVQLRKLNKSTPQTSADSYSNPIAELRKSHEAALQGDDKPSIRRRGRSTERRGMRKKSEKEPDKIWRVRGAQSVEVLTRTRSRSSKRNSGGFAYHQGDSGLGSGDHQKAGQGRSSSCGSNSSVRRLARCAISISQVRLTEETVREKEIVLPASINPEGVGTLKGEPRTPGVLPMKDAFFKAGTSVIWSPTVTTTATATPAQATITETSSARTTTKTGEPRTPGVLPMKDAFFKAGTSVVLSPIITTTATATPAQATITETSSARTTTKTVTTAETLVVSKKSAETTIGTIDNVSATKVAPESVPSAQILSTISTKTTEFSAKTAERKAVLPTIAMPSVAPTITETTSLTIVTLTTPSSGNSLSPVPSPKANREVPRRASSTTVDDRLKIDNRFVAPGTPEQSLGFETTAIAVNYGEFYHLCSPRTPLSPTNRSRSYSTSFSERRSTTSRGEEVWKRRSVGEPSPSKVFTFEVPSERFDILTKTENKIEKKSISKIDSTSKTIDREEDNYKSVEKIKHLSYSKHQIDVIHKPISRSENINKSENEDLTSWSKDNIRNVKNKTSESGVDKMTSDIVSGDRNTVAIATGFNDPLETEPDNDAFTADSIHSVTSDSVTSDKYDITWVARRDVRFISDVDIEIDPVATATDQDVSMATDSLVSFVNVPIKSVQDSTRTTDPTVGSSYTPMVRVPDIFTSTDIPIGRDQFPIGMVSDINSGTEISVDTDTVNTVTAHDISKATDATIGKGDVEMPDDHVTLGDILTGNGAASEKGSKAIDSVSIDTSNGYFTTTDTAFETDPVAMDKNPISTDTSFHTTTTDVTVEKDAVAIAADIVSMATDNAVTIVTENQTTDSLSDHFNFVTSEIDSSRSNYFATDSSANSDEIAMTIDPHSSMTKNNHSRELQSIITTTTTRTLTSSMTASHEFNTKPAAGKIAKGNDAEFVPTFIQVDAWKSKPAARSPSLGRKEKSSVSGQKSSSRPSSEELDDQTVANQIQIPAATHDYSALEEQSVFEQRHMPVDSNQGVEEQTVVERKEDNTEKVSGAELSDVRAATPNQYPEGSDEKESDALSKDASASDSSIKHEMTPEATTEGESSNLDQDATHFAEYSTVRLYSKNSSSGVTEWSDQISESSRNLIDLQYDPVTSFKEEGSDQNETPMQSKSSIQGQGKELKDEVFPVGLEYEEDVGQVLLDGTVDAVLPEQGDRKLEPEKLRPIIGSDVLSGLDSSNTDLATEDVNNNSSDLEEATTNIYNNKYETNQNASISDSGIFDSITTNVTAAPSTDVHFFDVQPSPAIIDEQLHTPTSATTVNFVDDLFVPVTDAQTSIRSDYNQVINASNAEWIKYEAGETLESLNLIAVEEIDQNLSQAQELNSSDNVRTNSTGISTLDSYISPIQNESESRNSSGNTTNISIIIEDHSVSEPSDLGISSISYDETISSQHHHHHYDGQPENFCSSPLHSDDSLPIRSDSEFLGSSISSEMTNDTWDQMSTGDSDSQPDTFYDRFELPEGQHGFKLRQSVQEIERERASNDIWVPSKIRSSSRQDSEIFIDTRNDTENITSAVTEIGAEGSTRLDNENVSAINEPTELSDKTKVDSDNRLSTLGLSTVGELSSDGISDLSISDEQLNDVTTDDETWSLKRNNDEFLSEVTEKDSEVEINRMNESTLEQCETITETLTTTTTTTTSAAQVEEKIKTEEEAKNSELFKKSPNYQTAVILLLSFLALLFALAILNISLTD